MVAGIVREFAVVEAERQLTHRVSPESCLANWQATTTPYSVTVAGVTTRQNAWTHRFGFADYESVSLALASMLAAADSAVVPAAALTAGVSPAWQFYSILRVRLAIYAALCSATI